MTAPRIAPPRPGAARATRHAATDDATLALRRTVASALRERVQGEVRFADVDRALYATDASPYEMTPIGVVLPRSSDDVQATLAVAARFGVPVLPRGGGTSLAGQTVAEAIVIDVSKYLHAIKALDVERRTVTVEPGVVRDHLNAYLAPYALQFTPDIATTNRANVGGMVANNSAGTRSIKYGKTVDQVVAMTVMFADGSVAELRELDDAELAAKLAAPGTEGEVYRSVARIVRDHADEIEARYPKVMRRVGGYNLDELVAPKPFNLAKLVCGSEGTLAFILDVTLRLHPVPAKRCLAMLHYDTLVGALESVALINRHGPSAVEIFDHDMFDLGRRNPALRPLLGWLEGEPAAVLAVEFDGPDEADLQRQLASLAGDAEIERRTYATHVAVTATEQHDIIEFRRKGLGIYATVKGPKKPTPFIEDAAIPIEHLATYVPEVLEICERHGARAVLYAHASVGVIHIRPHIDLKTVHGVATYRAIADEVFALVRRYGGSWSGEHGDGLIRSEKNRELFGDVLYEDFRALKRAFDPEGRFNPGKIVDAPPMTQHLRYGPDYPSIELDTVLDFGAQEGFGGAIEMCTGVGDCRKVGVGTMCPSYMATRDEDHSTRGRANVLREALTGGMPGGLTSREVYDVLDLCLECKACKAECPSQVDMAKIKYEFLQHYHDAHGTPLSVRAVGGVARLAPLAQRVAPLANAVLAARPVRWANERLLGIDRRRTLPAYARQRFDVGFVRRPASTRKPASQGGAESRGSVALFADTWTMFNAPAPGHAAVRVLEALGYRVELVPYRCCGRPLISKGLLRQAKRQAEGVVQALQPFVARGVPIVGLEPSCITALKDDYRDLVPGPRTDALADGAMLLETFLTKAWTRGEIDPATTFARNGRPVLHHGHCQQKAVLGTAATRAVLEWTSGEVRDLDAGCCGMAGSFGYSHHDVSMTIGEDRLFPAVRAHEGDTVACGFSCRHQIRDGTGKQAMHVAEALAAALGD
ncbi:MAG: FAD-binding protein [Trueperaceae bacterium]|nr:FAD-binding protein [Trueperaceae bacterium]